MILSRQTCLRSPRNRQALTFLRNPVDSETVRKQYAAFGLNDSEVDFIVGRTFKEMRFGMLVKRQAANESSVIDFGLNRLGDYLRVFQSGVGEVLELHDLMERYSVEESVHRYLRGGC